jgi:hypothetical protein
MKINFKGTELDVEFSYSPASKGSVDSFGAPLEPDYPAEIDVTNVKLSGMDITELCESAKIINDIEQLVWKEIAEEVPFCD